MHGRPEPKAVEFLQGGGQAGALLRGLDWSGNPLCDPAGWSQALKTLVGVMLNAHQPMFVTWGPEHIMLYNDAYGVLCGQRHPALGKRFEEVWYDILDDVGPILRRAYNGKPTQMDDITLTMHRNGCAEEAHHAFSYTPVRDETGGIAGMFCACNETTVEVNTRAILKAEKQRLHDLFQQAPSFMAVLTGPDHVFQFINPGYSRLVGQREVIGKPVREALPEVEGQGYFELLDQAFQSGAAYTGYSSPVMLAVAPQGPAQEQFIDFVYQPIKDEGGGVTGIFVEGYDVTDRVRAERKRNLLLHEMDHRVKNLFSITSSLVSLSAKSAATPAEMASVLTGRLSALAGAHDLIRPGLGDGAESRNNASLDDLVWTVLLPYVDDAGAEGDDRLRVEGPAIALGGTAVTTLALVLHELATNAAKYGALSRPDGRLNVHWTEDGARVRLTWRESHAENSGDAPASQGFGTRLVDGALAGLGGTIERAWTPDGLAVAMDLPLQRLA